MSEPTMLNESGELHVPSEHVDTVCTILTQIAKALDAGRVVLVGIDGGETTLIHCFANRGDPRALEIASLLIDHVAAHTRDVPAMNMPERMQ